MVRFYLNLVTKNKHLPNSYCLRVWSVKCPFTSTGPLPHVSAFLGLTITLVLLFPFLFALLMRSTVINLGKLCVLDNPDIPPSSRDEGLRLLHGLETNLATSLQTPQEA